MARFFRQAQKNEQNGLRQWQIVHYVFWRHVVYRHIAPKRLQCQAKVN